MDIVTAIKIKVVQKVTGNKNNVQMDFININNINSPYSNNEVYKSIKYILKTEADPFKRLSLISHFVQHISDENLLISTIKLFEGIDFLTNKLETTNITIMDNIEYSGVQKIKITAITHSLILSNEINIKYFSSVIQVSKIPELILILNNGIIEHNSTEIEEWIKRNTFKSVADTLIELPVLRDTENEIKKLIQSLNEIDYLNETDTFSNDIKYLNTIKNNLFEQIPLSTPAHENEENKMYFKVGLLFAQKKIFSKIVVIDKLKNTKYCYIDEVFDNPSQLSKRLNLTRQYINDSFNNADTKHNIFKNLKQLKNIIDYCNKNTITIDPEFLNKYSTLVENKQ